MFFRSGLDSKCRITVHCPRVFTDALHGGYRAERSVSVISVDNFLFATSTRTAKPDCSEISKMRILVIGVKWPLSGLFSDLPKESLDAFSEHAITHGFPKGTTLFVEGQPANGVYVLCSGKVKLLTYSEDGRAIIVRVAEAGGILGLPACVAGVTFEVSAEVIIDCQVNFIRREDFLSLLQTDHNAALGAMRELSLLYHSAHTQICSLGLSASASDKLAKLFLYWCDNSGDAQNSAHIQLNYTHEEIAEMIGTSRETVTRLIKTFKMLNLIRLDGSKLIIPNKRNLRDSIGTRNKNVTSLTAVK